MKIGLLTHSVNPRGGVIHTLELGRSLTEAGHDVTIMAPAGAGQTFFRETPCRVSLAPLAEHGPGMVAMVAARIKSYCEHLRKLPDLAHYDVLHAQDSISGNALCDLKAAGDIDTVVRTVHHLDTFDEEQLTAWQTRAFVQADRVFCVSDSWVNHLRMHYGVQAHRVSNGVDTQRFQPLSDAYDHVVRAQYALPGDAPIFLSVGGIEARKNTLGILQAFAQVRRTHPRAVWLIAGGSSLLDHDAYLGAFRDAQRALGLDDGAVVQTGKVADAAMPALYRCADVLVMTSLREGFGLAALEAMACATPAVVSNRAPFTEHLGPQDCLFADPTSRDEMAHAMLAALSHRPDARAVLARHTWQASARAHLQGYASLPAPHVLAH